MHSRGRRVRLRRHCMITRPPSAVAPPLLPRLPHAACHMPQPPAQFACHLGALSLCVAPLSTLGACSICYLFLLCPAVATCPEAAQTRVQASVRARQGQGEGGGEGQGEEQGAEGGSPNLTSLHIEVKT